MRCMACGEEMRLIQAVADDSMAVPGFEQHVYRCPGCNDTEQRLAFVHPDDPAPRRVEPIGDTDLPDVTLAPAAQAAGEQDAPPVAQATEPGREPDDKPDDKPAPNAWQKHRSRWSALRQRLGLPTAAEATRKDTDAAG
jgi:hypothetical protein